jgi:hypothetical protein
MIEQVAAFLILGAKLRKISLFMAKKGAETYFFR